jgi:hypothetical protein
VGVLVGWYFFIRDSRDARKIRQVARADRR